VLPHIKILLSANVASTNNPTLGKRRRTAPLPQSCPRRAGRLSCGQLPEHCLQSLHLTQQSHRIEGGILLAQPRFALLGHLFGLQTSRERLEGLPILMIHGAPL